MKKRSHSARRCSFEGLEDRRLMAGDVFARIERGNLIIRGDDGNNGVFVRAGFAPGEVIVLGTDVFGEGTRVNGLENTAVTLNGFNGRIEFTMNGGADRIRIQDLPTSRGIVADLGRGTEGRFELFGHTANGDVSVKSLEGNDSVTLDNVNVNGSLTVDMGDGANVLNSDLTAVRRDAKFLGGRQSDNVTIENLNVTGDLLTNLGDGPNDMLVQLVTANRAEIKGGRNVDSFQWEAITANSITADLGDGDDAFNLLAPRVFRDLRITAGGGNDNVVTDESTVDGNAYFDMGEGNNNLSIALDIEREVAIRGGRGTDSVRLSGEFWPTPIVYRSLKVELGDGANTLNAIHVSVRGKAEFKGGKNEDTVTWNTAAFDTFFADLGGGTNSFNFQSNTVKRDFHLKAGDGNDTGQIVGSTISGNTKIDLGDGNNGFFTLISSNFHGDVAVLGGDGSDSPFFHQVHIFKSLRIDLGDGSNVFSVLVLTVDRRTEYQGGKGVDLVELISFSSASLNVAMGKGNDLLELASVSTTQSTRFDGGDGQDSYLVAEFFPNSFASLERKSFEIMGPFHPA